MAVALKKLSLLLALLFLGFTVSAATFNGFYQKWDFRDDATNNSIKEYLDGTAKRPWAYRRMVPDLVNATEQALPAATRQMLVTRLRTDTGGPVSGVTSPIANADAYILRYHMIYYGLFLAMCALLAAMYAFLRTSGSAPLPAFAAASASMLLMPYIQSIGGYFYDYIEYLFMLLFLICALRGPTALMVVLAALAAWNKESFLFFVPAAFPFLRARLGVRPAALWLGACGFVAGLVYQVQRMRFAANPGESVEIHLREQYWFFRVPQKWLGHEETYGIVGPSAFNILCVIAIAGLVARSWPMLNRVQRTHIAIAGAINLPLYLLFCAAGEMRNLSFLYPGLLLLIAAAFTAWQANGEARR